MKEINKKVLIVLSPALLIFLASWISESIFCMGDCGYFTAMIAGPVAMFWIAVSSLAIIIYRSYKLKEYRYIWFSLLIVLLYIILAIIGFEEFLFNILIIYFIGLLVIKFTYKNKTNVL
jgi:hypothetical protein